MNRKLVLLDGTAALYRAFYAIAELSTSDGRPTNALFGFIRILKQLGRLWNPSHWAVVFDGGLPQERLDLLEDYKAQRKPMPTSLKAQIAPVQEYLKRARVACFREQGQEADDLLASLAVWAKGESADVLIATSDKDMFQLIDDRVCIVPISGKGAVLDAAGVKEKTGVEPSRIVEWLALVGDSSDNIPGVPGIGAKTAARLLNECGRLETLWEGRDGAPHEKLRNVLKAHRDLVQRNLRMVRLRTDLVPAPDWDTLAVRGPDHSGLLEFFQEYQLTSFAQQIQEQDLFGDDRAIGEKSGEKC